jgi:D-alanine--poly(phosphoribitol) ligase subunit 1
MSDLAFWGPGDRWTHAQLARRARDLAAELAGESSPVLLYGHKEPELVAGMLAAARAGRPYVPVDSALPAERLMRIAAIARPGAVIAAEPLPVPVELLCGDPAPAVPGLAYILFTSGTTGDPKGVQIPRRALDHFVGWLCASQGFAPGAEVFLNQAPFHFDLSVMDLYGALRTGGTIFALERQEIADPRRLFARLDGAPVTVWVSTPSFARLCLAEPRFGSGMLPRLRRFLFCGETLSADLARALFARFPGAEVWNTYGPTETTVAVTLVRITPDMADPLPIGRPAPGMEVWVGEGGELTVAGPQVGLGYLGAAQGGYFRLPDGRPAYRTGDLGHVGEDGLLYCDGRIDRQIKLHGYRLEPEEIEAHLRDLPGVADAAVVAAPRGGRPDHLVAFVVSAVDPAELRAALARRLPAYALPRFIRPVAALPLTLNGKLDRRALEDVVRR